MGNVVVQEEQPASAEEQRLRTGAAFAARPRYKLILRPMKGEMHAELWPIIQLGQQPEGTAAAATALDSNINKHSIAVLYVLSFPPNERERQNGMEGKGRSESAAGG